MNVILPDPETMVSKVDIITIIELHGGIDGKRAPRLIGKQLRNWQKIRQFVIALREIQGFNPKHPEVLYCISQVIL